MESDFSRFVARVSVFAALILLLSAVAGAQITASTGALRGIVTDPSGAVIPNATVSITSVQGAVQTKMTSGMGEFTFPLLPPGAYSVRVEAKGFQIATYNAVAVKITEITDLPVRLRVGGEGTTVMVESSAIPVVNTTTATLGETISGNVINNMPLATRNFTGLLALNPGTTSSLPSAATAGRASSTVFVAGMRGTFNNLVINGVDANNLGNNNFLAVAIPAPDTIEEFRVQTSLYDASQGKTSGGNINVVTKSGTQGYHGEAYEFFRNEALNANGWFFNHTGAVKPELRQNQFGGNFGGPVPKAGKTYFFLSYMQTKQVNGVSSAVTQKWPVLPATRSAANIESAFGLPAGSVDPVALKLLNAPGQFGGFLIPSGVGGAPGSLGQVAISEPLKFNDRQFNTNADRWFGQKHHLAAKFFYAQGASFDPLGGSDLSSFGSGETDPSRNRLGTLTHTWMISNNLVNEARVGFNRIKTARTANEPTKLSDIGMTRFNSSIYSGIPDMFTFDLVPSFGGITTNADQAAVANTYTIADTLAWTHGVHSFRFGFETRRYQINLFNNFASRGFIGFLTFNDFLQGKTFDTFVGTGQTTRNFRAHDYSVFAQDDWRITRRLTLNLGLRWDYMGPSTDTLNRLGNFDPTLLDAATLANGGPGLLKGFVLPAAADFGAIKGTPGVSASTLNGNDYNNFAPRVGFAFDPFGNGKSALHGGYGMYFIRISNQMLLQLITAAPFFQLSRVTSTSALGRSFADPYPALPVPADFPIFPIMPTLTTNPLTQSSTLSAPSITINPFERDMQTPYAQHWNLTYEQELGKGFMAQIGYLGSKGTRLLYGRQLNQAVLANDANPIRGITLNSSAGGNVNARVPVPGFASTGLNAVTDEGMSSYHAFILAVNRHVGSLFLQANYTWSQAFDNNSGSPTQDLGSSVGNQLDTRNSRGLSDFDRTNRLQFSYSYDLPFFKKGALRRVLGGWNVGGLTTIQTGLPITFTCSAACGSNLFGLASSTMLPNANASLNNIYLPGAIQSNIDGKVINTALFSPVSSSNRGSFPVFSGGQSISGLNQFGAPGDQTFTIAPGATNQSVFGNLGRNPGPHGPRQQQFDIYIGKTVPVTESFRAVFRAEMFNAFNHPSFNRPNGTVGSVAFGTIASTVSDPRIIQFALKLQF